MAKKITFSLPEEIIDLVKAKAKESKRTNSGVLRIAIERYLGDLGEK